MRLRRPAGTRSSAVALTLAVCLTGAPDTFHGALETEHRCDCPADAHACSCPRCAAAKARTVAKARCHGASRAEAAVAAARPPCHGGAATPPREEAPPSTSGTPCFSAGCHGGGAVAASSGSQDPFVLGEQRGREALSWQRDLAITSSLGLVRPSAPEPPPPRA